MYGTYHRITGKIKELFALDPRITYNSASETTTKIEEKTPLFYSSLSYKDKNISKCEAEIAPNLLKVFVNSFLSKGNMEQGLIAAFIKLSDDLIVNHTTLTKETLMKFIGFAVVLLKQASKSKFLRNLDGTIEEAVVISSLKLNEETDKGDDATLEVELWLVPHENEHRFKLKFTTETTTKAIKKSINLSNSIISLKEFKPCELKLVQPKIKNFIKIFNKIHEIQIKNMGFSISNSAYPFICLMVIALLGIAIMHLSSFIKYIVVNQDVDYKAYFKENNNMVSRGLMAIVTLMIVVSLKNTDRATKTFKEKLQNLADNNSVTSKKNIIQENTTNLVKEIDAEINTGTPETFLKLMETQRTEAENNLLIKVATHVMNIGRSSNDVGADISFLDRYNAQTEQLKKLTSLSYDLNTIMKKLKDENRKIEVETLKKIREDFETLTKAYSDLKSPEMVAVANNILIVCEQLIIGIENKLKNLEIPDMKAEFQSVFRVQNPNNEKQTLEISFRNDLMEVHKQLAPNDSKKLCTKLSSEGLKFMASSPGGQGLKINQEESRLIYKFSHGQKGNVRFIATIKGNQAIFDTIAEEDDHKQYITTVVSKACELYQAEVVIKNVA